MARKSSASRVLTDHDEIREWVEGRGGKPACVKGTGETDDAGLLRIDFPGYSGEKSLQTINWDKWLEKFDQNNLALLVQDQTAGGERSNFNKLVNRESVEETKGNSRRASGRSSGTRKQTSRKTSSSVSRKNRRKSTKSKSAGRNKKPQGTAGTVRNSRSRKAA